MSEKKTKGRVDAVMIHDGRAWRLYAGSLSGAFVSPAAKLPAELLELAVASKCRSVRFLLSGNVHRMDEAIPKGIALAKANATILASVAETTGEETEGMLAAGNAYRWSGVRKPFTLAARFDVDLAHDLRDALAEEGITCAGFASLELALLKSWQEPGKSKEAFAAVAEGETFILPAQRGGNQGPRSIACGLRHFSSDAESGVSRFRRGSVDVDVSDALHILSLSSSVDVAEILRDAGYKGAVAEDLDRWLASAAKATLKSKPNKLAENALPVANPFEPRKKFSNAWLVIAAAIVLALPAAFRWACAWSAERECKSLALKSIPFKPLEEKIKKATKTLAAAQNEYSSELAAERRLVEMRRPLMAFIDVAHFFCKNSGASVTLESIVQNGSTVEVKGSFSDPEDGVKMNNALLEHAKKSGIEIAGNETVRGERADTAFVNNFKLTLDCSNVGGKGLE